MTHKRNFLIGIIIIGLICMTLSFFVTYMVNSGKTTAKSLIDDKFNQGIEEIHDAIKDKEKGVDKKNNNTIGYILNSIFFIKNTYADEKIVDNLTPLKFSPKIYKLLEKYYILSSFNVDTEIPKEIFIYGTTNFVDFPKVLNAFDYFNGTHTLSKFLELQKKFKNKTFYKETIRDDVKKIIKNFYRNKNSNIIINFFPKDIIEDEGFQFMISGLNNNKILLSNSKRLGKQLGFDYHLTLAAILTEQFRYAGTYRGYVKSYLKKTPFIFSMTKWSYGIGGIKEDTGKKIKEDAIIYDNKSVFDSEKSDIYKDFTEKDFLQDKYWETIYPNVLISNIINRWNKAGYSIDNKPGIIMTLYNFGNSSNKKPHENPKVGGAIITLHGKKYTFGGLGGSLYYYIKVYGLY